MEAMSQSKKHIGEGPPAQGIPGAGDGLTRNSKITPNWQPMEAEQPHTLSYRVEVREHVALCKTGCPGTLTFTGSITGPASGTAWIYEHCCSGCRRTAWLPDSFPYLTAERDGKQISRILAEM